MSISRHQTTAVYQLRIQLRGISPPIWRRLLIPVTSTILNLHEAIQAVMGWEDIHLRLHLSEAHELLNHGQSAMVTAQVNEFIDNARQCPNCHRHLGCKGHHEVVYRTVFGTLHADSPRLYHCPDCQGKRTSFNPLAQCLTERTESGIAVFADQVCLIAAVWCDRRYPERSASTRCDFSNKQYSAMDTAHGETAGATK